MVRCVDDLHKLLGHEGRAADEASVDVGLGQQLGGVLLVHGPAVLDRDAPGHPGAVQGADGGADVGADLTGLLGGGGLAGADGPDGLIGDDAAAQLVGGHAVQGALHLEGDPLAGDSGLPLLQALAHADDGIHAGVQYGVDLLVDCLVGLAEILAALAVAHDDVFYAQVLQHFGGHLAGVGALLLKVDVLGAHGDAQVLEGLGGGGDVAGGDADQRLAPLGPGQDLLDLLGEFLGLSGGHVHLPVAGDDGFTISAIHSVSCLLLLI